MLIGEYHHPNSKAFTFFLEHSSPTEKRVSIVRRSRISKDGRKTDSNGFFCAGALEKICALRVKANLSFLFVVTQIRGINFSKTSANFR